MGCSESNVAVPSASNTTAPQVHQQAVPQSSSVQLKSG